jgi:hypothetical protein
MPTVFRGGDFHVIILPPPREHGPPHVHVLKAGATVIIYLPQGDQMLAVRKINGMRDDDVTRALRLVEEHAEFLITVWRRYHGLSQTD